MTPRVLGLDLSLAATGVALPGGHTATVGAGKRVGVDRLRHLRDLLLETARGPRDVDLVVVEGFAMGSKRQAYSYEIGGLGWVVRVALTEAGVRWIEIPPAQLKRYATGRGNAPKEAMLAAAIRRLGYDGHDHNCADALFLRAAGMELLGHPVVKLPAGQVAALDALREKMPA